MMICVVGPTGVGKSEVAVELARRLSGEIVAVDSMQVYRGMDLGTGKPDPALRREIPHHGLDLVEPEEEFNVARYRREVAPVIESVRSQGKPVILVGGSGLYFRALLDGLCQAPAEDPALRSRLWEEARVSGSEQLYARLHGVDRPAAARIHPNDAKRIIRALEVFQATGRPISQWQQETTRPFVSPSDCRWIGLTCDRAILYRRIEERIDGWIRAGWLEEARSLHRRRLSRTAREALGCRELFDTLEGRTDWEAAVALIKQNSRRYAKRQLGWFRQDSRIDWIPVDGLSPESIADLIGTSAPRQRSL